MVTELLLRISAAVTELGAETLMKTVGENTWAEVMRISPVTDRVMRASVPLIAGLRASNHEMVATVQVTEIS